MSDMTITFIILAITMVLFIWGRWQPDLVAVGSLLALYLTGVIALDEAFSGFDNTTVVLIAALFIVGEGLSRTGVTAYFGERLIGSADVVTAAKACQRGATRRPEPAPVEQRRQLVEVQVHHEQAVLETVHRWLCSRVPNSPFVDAALHWQVSVRSARAL